LASELERLLPVRRTKAGGIDTGPEETRASVATSIDETDRIARKTHHDAVSAGATWRRSRRR
jgi:hypothetical protein